MHALQRVHRSRSIGLSCVHCASNAPSQPVERGQAAAVDRDTRARPAARCPACAPVDSTVTREPLLQHVRPAQRGVERADDQHLSLASWYDTLGTGSGSGSAACASSAASLGVAPRASRRPAAGLAQVDEADRLRLARPRRRSRRTAAPPACSRRRRRPRRRRANDASCFWHSIVCTTGACAQAERATRRRPRRSAPCRCTSRGRAAVASSVMRALRRGDWRLRRSVSAAGRASASGSSVCRRRQRSATALRDVRSSSAASAAPRALGGTSSTWPCALTRVFGGSNRNFALVELRDDLGRDRHRTCV